MSSLDEIFTNICDAIRHVKKTEDKIKVSDIAENILSLDPDYVPPTTDTDDTEQDNKDDNSEESTDSSTTENNSDTDNNESDDSTSEKTAE